MKETVGGCFFWTQCIKETFDLIWQRRRDCRVWTGPISSSFVFWPFTIMPVSLKLSRTLFRIHDLTNDSSTLATVAGSEIARSGATVLLALARRSPLHLFQRRFVAAHLPSSSFQFPICHQVAARWHVVKFQSGHFFSALFLFLKQDGFWTRPILTWTKQLSGDQFSLPHLI